MRGLPGICATKAKKQLTNEYFAGHNAKGHQKVCLFVCATKYLCCDSAREESFLISLKEIATTQVDLTRDTSLSPLSTPLAISSSICLCKQTRTSVNSSRSP